MGKWYKNAIIYHVFIDRFAGYRDDCDSLKSDFCGGNIKGLTSKIGYIKKMGANTIWLSPFYKSTSYHGYHITNYKKVEPEFGNMENLKHFITKCKKNGIRIIVDIVPNHCSRHHPWFVDAQKQKNSKYNNWFYFKNWPDDYLCFLEFKELPKLNLQNNHLAETMLDILIYWAKMGIDGFRIDHVLGVPDPFLVELRKKLKELNPDFLLIGEAWGAGTKYKSLRTFRLNGKYKLWKSGFSQYSIQKHYEGILDGVLDFEWRNMLLHYSHMHKKIDKGFVRLVKEYEKNYDPEFVLPRFLDNHDTPRIMNICMNNDVLFKELIKTLFTQKQPIIIYYGTESGLGHTPDVNDKIPYSDLNARGLINWNLDTQPYYNLISRLSARRASIDSIKQPLP